MEQVVYYCMTQMRAYKNLEGEGVFCSQGGKRVMLITISSYCSSKAVNGQTVGMRRKMKLQRFRYKNAQLCGIYTCIWFYWPSMDCQ